MKVYPGGVDVVRGWVSWLRVQMYNVGVVGDHILVSVPSHVLLRGRNRSSLSGVDVILNEKFEFLEFHFMLILKRLEAGWEKDF